MDDSEIVQHLKGVLTAAGVTYELAFRIDSAGRACFVDSAGYEFCWQVKPMEFTFDETIALGTPTMPSLEIIIRDPETGNSASMEMPMPYAVMFLKTALKELEMEYLESKDDIASFVQMNRIHGNAEEKLGMRKKLAEKARKEEDDDGRYFV